MLGPYMEQIDRAQFPLWRLHPFAVLTSATGDSHHHVYVAP